MRDTHHLQQDIDRALRYPWLPDRLEKAEHKQLHLLYNLNTTLSRMEGHMKRLADAAEVLAKATYR